MNIAEWLDKNVVYFIGGALASGGAGILLLKSSVSKGLALLGSLFTKKQDAIAVVQDKASLKVSKINELYNVEKEIAELKIRRPIISDNAESLEQLDNRLSVLTIQRESILSSGIL